MSENKHTGQGTNCSMRTMSRLQSVISGKWKILIIWYIAVYEVQRFPNCKGGWTALHKLR